MRYFLNLIFDGYFDGGVEASDDLDALLDEQVRCGWEEPPENAVKNIYTITDGYKGPVKATIMWVPVEGQEQPDLLIVLDSGETRRYAYVHGEDMYTSRRVV